jgi:hypothetical protein
MAHVRDLINAHQAAVALVGAAQAAGSANLAQGAKVFGPLKTRVFSRARVRTHACPREIAV